MRAAVAAFLCVIHVFPQCAAADGLGRIDPNRGLFPDSSLVDFSFLLDPPAGKYGHLGVDYNGRFAWSNGKRARFWGVNISNRSVFTTRENIDTVVEVLARAGTNMVRFEALDSVGALLDIPGKESSRRINPEKMQTLDYWTSKLRARGIYYYFDLLDFRQFKRDDDVPAYDQLGRAAKPYAMFDRRLIDLQKEFARQLLAHRNQYTKLKYIEDPALALLEICNEHGLFFKTASLDSLAEPYGRTLRRQWNDWLVSQYGTREAINAAWGLFAKTQVLEDDESPTAGTVSLPDFSTPPAQTPADPGIQPSAGQPPPGLRRMPGRVRDGTRFLYTIQRDYFREMKRFLVDLGVRIPITGVVSSDMVADMASAAAELDFTSENYYADHPAFAGKDWEGTFFYNDTNPLRASSTYQLAPWLSGLRWENKPVVVREWATVWPNRYRAISIPEMAAYAGLQDFDAVLLFGYQIARDPDSLRDFDHQADPPVWGLFGLAAQTFLRGDVEASRYAATIQYSPDTLFRWPNILGNLHRLSWFVRLNSAHQPRLASSAKPAEPPNGYMGWLLPFTAIAPTGIEISPGDSSTLGQILDRFAISGAAVRSSMLSSGVLAGSTGQIVRRTQDGLLTIDSQRTVAICGEFPPNKSVESGGWSLFTQTGIGALMIVSLDGKPIANSRHYVVKLVSRAENTDQGLEPSPQGAPARFHLTKWGHAPILTFGRACEIPTMLRKRGKEILSLGLIDGTWELLVKDGQAILYCDTPGIRGTLFGKPITTTNGAEIAVQIPEDTKPGIPKRGKISGKKPAVHKDARSGQRLRSGRRARRP